jgi:integral membrane protein
MDTAFRRYRLMSFVTGTTLLSLFATLALQKIDLSAWQSISWFVRLDGVAHGVVLFPIYMIMSFQFVLKAKLPVLLLALMFFAGFVPGLAFYMEYRLRRRFYPEFEFRK